MKILTAVVNNIEFIKIQCYTLKKYFKGNYEFIVFNDAKPFVDFTNNGDLTLRKKIRDVCKDLDICCVDIPNETHIHNRCAAQRCADSMNFILKYQLENPDQYLIIDSDMFLISDIDESRYSGYDCAIVLQTRNENKIYYPWNGLFYFDITRMRNTDLLNWNMIPNCDVGGMMYEWMIKQMYGQTIPTPELLRKTKKSFCNLDTYFIHHLWSLTWDETELPENIKHNSKLIEYFKTDSRNQNGKFFCEIYDDSFLHYRAGGNWRGEGEDFHRYRTELLKHVIMDVQ